MPKTALIPLMGLLIASFGACDGGQTTDYSPKEEEPVCGAAMDAITPEAAAALTEGGEPNFDCLDNPETLSAGQNITLQGCLDIFGIGNLASPNLKVAVFSRDQDASTEDPNYGVSDVALRTTEGEMGTLADACPYKGFYRIENVPTHERLILKIYDTSDAFSRVAVNTYVYDVFLKNDEIEDDAVNYEPVVIYNSSYDSIPTLAGRPIDGAQVKDDGTGRAVVAGEMHDCDGLVVHNTNVIPSYNDAQARMVYTNGDPDDPTPDISRSSTNTDGVYVYLNANTDEACMAQTFTGCIMDGSECKTIGSTTINVYPDSVTLVNIRVAWPVVE